AYDDRDIVIDYYGTERDNNICPENEAKSIRLQLYLYNTNYGHGFDSTSRLRLNDPSVWVSIGNALGLSVSSFFNQVLANPSVCFKPK
ncbi:MAG: hypothetical protein WBW94_13035, partial [Anaerolineales bacterium]